MNSHTPQSPLFKDALRNASAHQERGKLGEAEKIYREILQIHPDHIAAITNCAKVLQDQGKLDEAIAMFRRAVSVRSDMALAHRNLGVILCQNGFLEEGFETFQRHARLTYSNDAVPPHKARHDQEQHDYLKEISGNTSEAFHLEDGSRVSGRAVNPDISRNDAVTQWPNSKPQIAVIDNFLTDEALEKLRRFCWGSTIWQKSYSAGYLGAMPEHGIGSPLLAQIAEELRSSCPVIFEQHPLLHYWGFKYDSRLSGIALHADFAAVNVNFWITPDDANLDPDSGGLIIWDVPAPLDWGFAKYNDNVKAARDFLTRSRAQAVKVPYRSNRVVIFDSDLFHETDRIAFKEGYLNRRINLTLLYGRREV